MYSFCSYCTYFLKILIWQTTNILLIAIPVNVLSPKAINQFIVNHFDSDRKSPKST